MSEWEDAVNREFLDRVGIILARWYADRIDATEAIDELRSDYEMTIGDLPDVADDDENEKESN